ncbi:alpha-mannosidase [Isoptericola sp. QY 916]|uniref:alpha-mannosidase n=1 Tax=Isoptericola sp. QY 916 TaxID=2782570 RepID=UPI003D2FFF3D|nr:alpha-mannosidase [Isoptericola sp. QY 916]
MGLEPDDVTLGRVRRFVDERLAPALDAARAPVTVTAWSQPGEPVRPDVVLALPDDAFHPVAPGEPWGTPWSTTWLRLRGEVPAAWAGEESRVDLEVDLGFTRDTPGFQAEGTARAHDGRVLKGISPYNRRVPLPLLLRADRTGWDAWSAGAAALPVDVWVEAAANPVMDPDFTFAPTPLGDLATLPAVPQYAWGEIGLRLRDDATWGLWRDVRVLREQLEVLPDPGLRRGRVLRALARMLDVVQVATPEALRASAPAARAELAGVLAEGNGDGGHEVVAVGHAHIDSAWLWPFRETRRKVVRTYSNALALLEEYPETTFVTSSAQHLAWVQESEPELFERIRAAVRAGRFLPVGGMWVESDTVLLSGESMVRQLLEGTTWFSDELGVRCREVWLPDSFGYSAALPQIFRAAGMRRFLSQKMSWNDTNRMPHHTFTWEGIDGSRVLAHFPPVDNYNSDLTPRQLAHAEANVADSDTVSADLSLAPSGWGDGGGGPTREHAETARRVRELAGSARVAWGTPDEFFSRSEALAAAARERGEAEPVWVGEMPLELHRGVSTSQQRLKADNRRSESALREAELWCATATRRAGAAYPLDELRGLWRTVLLHQFHDVLPGSSIAWVYQDAARDHERVQRRCAELVAGALDVLAGAGSQGEPTTGRGELWANPSPVVLDGVESLSVGPRRRSEPASVVAHDATWTLQDDALRVVVDASGHVVSLVDRATGRDAVAAAGPANVARLFRDLPNRWDAWDVDAHARRVARDVPEARVGLEDGAIVVERVLGPAGSTLVQRLALVDGALEVTTDVDWHEREELLVLSWPLDVRAQEVAAETQFGHVRRPTHRNTSWQSARFVDVAHRWVHLGDAGFGVGIANRTTQGYDAASEVRPDGGTTTTVNLHLLRGPRYPDPGADLGRHTFVHRVRPGAGVADAVRDGYALSLPPRPAPAGVAVEPLVRLDGPGLLVESVKLAHDGSGDLVVRLYEPLGAQAGVGVTFDGPGTVTRVDLLEEPLGDEADGCSRFEARSDGAGCGAALVVRPFGIVTLRVTAQTAPRTTRGREAS